eukprot:1143994-Pelagomonas_calceolata.AAC.2
MDAPCVNSSTAPCESPRKQDAYANTCRLSEMYAPAKVKSQLLQCVHVNTSAVFLSMCLPKSRCKHLGTENASRKKRKGKKNYVGSETLPTSIEERGPHWCTDRMTHPPRSSD